LITVDINFGDGFLKGFVREGGSHHAKDGANHLWRDVVLPLAERVERFPQN
jgi:hypothetical protein